jgi:hypothetical protein
LWPAWNLDALNLCFPHSWITGMCHLSWPGNISLTVTKTTEHQENIHVFDNSKTFNFCSSKETIKKVKHDGEGEFSYDIL